MLFASRGVNHFGEPLDVFDEKRISLPLNETNARQASKLARDSLAMGADAACDLGMGGRRFDACRLAARFGEPRQPQQLGLNAIAYGKRAELVDAGRQRPNFPEEVWQWRLRHHGL